MNTPKEVTDTEVQQLAKALVFLTEAATKESSVKFQNKRKRTRWRQNAMLKTIVVVNDNEHGLGLRHIVKSKNFESIDAFKEQYYKECHKLDGDRFYIFDTAPLAMEFATSIIRGRN